MQKILLLALILSAVSTQEFSNPDGIPFTLSMSTVLLQRHSWDGESEVRLLGRGISDNNAGESFHWLGWKMPVSNTLTLSGYLNVSNHSGNSGNSQNVQMTLHLPLYKLLH